MGRPTNKRAFGNPSTKDGNQFWIQANVGSGEEKCFIVKQTGSERFVVEAVSDATQYEVYLVDGPANVTGAGEGYIEAGGSGSTVEANTASVVAAGTGYLVADVVTVAGSTGTAATFDINKVYPISGDEIIHTTFVGGDGIGGTAYIVNDTITLSDGSVVTVDTIDANDDVLTFTLDSSASTGSLTDAAVLTQASTSGTGTDFVLTVETADQAVYDVVVLLEGSMTATGSNPNTVTGGTGTGLTLNVAYSSTTDEYVAKLSNKNLRVFGGTKRESYVINAAGSADRDVAGE